MGNYSILLCLQKVSIMLHQTPLMLNKTGIILRLEPGNLFTNNKMQQNSMHKSISGH